LKKYDNECGSIAFLTIPDSEVVNIKDGEYKTIVNNIVFIIPIKRFLSKVKSNLIFFSLKIIERKSQITVTPKEYKKVGIVKNPKEEKIANKSQPNLLLEFKTYFEIINVRRNKKQRRVYPLAFVEYSIKGDDAAIKLADKIAVFLL
jgi:hypothetical protein